MGAILPGEMAGVDQVELVITVNEPPPERDPAMPDVHDGVGDRSWFAPGVGAQEAADGEEPDR